MDERHRQIQAWLSSLFCSSSVPQYEITPRTITILYELMLRSKHKEENMTIIEDDLQQRIDEYSLEADRMRVILGKMGLTGSVLSQPGIVSLKSLARIALLLGTKDASETSLLLGLNDQTLDRQNIESDRQTEKRLQSQLLKKTKDSLQTLNNLGKSLASFEKQSKYQAPEQRAKQAGFLQSKAKEYRENAQQLNIELSKTGVDPTLYHHNLVRASENLVDLKARLQPLKSKLESYQDLPWDHSQAKVKVEEAKRELAGLETELSKHINVMHL